MDPELFFPTKGGTPWRAKRVCAQCPVKDDCLLDALATPRTLDYGVRGGTTESERRKLRRGAA